MILNYITWNVNPEVISIGVLTIRWYGVMWATGIFLALVIVSKLYKHEKLPENWIDKKFIYVVTGTILGARLGHCLFYEWHMLSEPVTILGIPFTYGNYYLSHPWQIFNVFNGGLTGLSSHGGAFGIIAAMYLYNKKVTHKGFLWGFDRVVIGAAITGACIRFGNLMNSEIYGGVTNLPWGFIFVRDPHGDGLPHHPTQIYEMLYCLITFAIIWYMYWKKQAYKRTGLIFGVFLIGIFGTRFLLEFIKLDQEYFEQAMLINMGQILSIPFIIWGIYLVATSKNRIQPEPVVKPANQQVKHHKAKKHNK